MEVGLLVGDYVKRCYSTVGFNWNLKGIYLFPLQAAPRLNRYQKTVVREVIRNILN